MLDFTEGRFNVNEPTTGVGTVGEAGSMLLELLKGGMGEPVEHPGIYRFWGRRVEVECEPL